MNIEAIIVCDGYDDFLAQTLPRNLPQFDRIVVVTGFNDVRTIELCKHLGVQCIPTDVMHAGGAAFNKGAAIDLGLSFCKRDDWVVHLDADIYLPSMSRRWIEQTNPDRSCIYGIDRVLCRSWEQWQRYIGQPPQHHTGHTHHCLVTPPEDMPMGSRIALAGHGGFIPIGFFQMFHGSHGRRYPRCQSDSAEHSDVLFSLQWPTDKRRLLGSVFGIHLESARVDMGANWNGRRTGRFGPSQTGPSNFTSTSQRPYCR